MPHTGRNGAAEIEIYVKLNAEQKVCVQKAAIRCKYIENIESTDHATVEYMVTPAR